MANRNYLLSFSLYVPLKGGGVLIGDLREVLTGSAICVHINGKYVCDTY